MLRFALLAALTACGRLDIGAALDARVADSTGDVAADSLDGVPACIRAGSAPDPLVVAGSTFRYTSSDNMHAPLVGAKVTALSGSTELGSDTSMTGGAYSFSFATGGVAPAVNFKASATGYYDTLLTVDESLDHSLAGTGTALLALGDFPLWSSAMMNNIYGSVGVVHDPTQFGTLNIGIRGCDDAPIDGVTVELDPPSGQRFYQAVDGTLAPSNLQAATIGPFDHIIFLGVSPGPVTVRAYYGTRPFPTTEVTLANGTTNVMTFVHGVDPN